MYQTVYNLCFDLMDLMYIPNGKATYNQVM